MADGVGDDGACRVRPSNADAVAAGIGTPPAAPGPGGSEWRCRCGNLLGFLDGGWLLARHRGRAITARLPARVQCEDCGYRQTRLPQGTDAAPRSTAAD